MAALRTQEEPSSRTGPNGKLRCGGAARPKSPVPWLSTPRLTQRYTAGEPCKLTKLPRETTVHYTCGPTDQLQRVEEPAPCLYELHASVRAACGPAPAEELRDG